MKSDTLLLGHGQCGIEGLVLASTIPFVSPRETMKANDKGGNKP